MTEQADTALRAATFALVQQLRERYANRIPSEELSKGVEVNGVRVPVWNYQKGIFKPAVLGKDGAALSVQTSAKSPYGDVHDPDAGHFIYKYRGSDPFQADNVALRQAMNRQRPILYLVAVDPGVYDAIFPVYVTGDDVHALQFTLAADQPSLLASAAVMADSKAVTLRREYVTRAVMVRLHQQRFRRLVLDAYRRRCSICRLRHAALLDAAHILADRHPAGEPVISNGLGMCKIHHAAYDANILGIDPDARVHIRDDILREIDGPMLRHGLQELHSIRLELPRVLHHRPNRDFLSERFERFQQA